MVPSFSQNANNIKSGGFLIATLLLAQDPNPREIYSKKCTRNYTQFRKVVRSYA